MSKLDAQLNKNYNSKGEGGRLNSQKTFSEIKILERNHAFDAMRFFGVLIIILAHSGPPSWLFQIRNFGTPLLIISSALAHNYIYQHRSFVWKKYYKKRFKRLIIPAWIFLIIFFLSGLFICLLFDIKFPFPTKTIVYSFMFWSGIGYVWIFKVYIILALITPLSLYINNYIDDNKKLLLFDYFIFFL